MEEHKSTFASGGFMYRATDDGEWENLGYVDEGGVSFASDSDEEELDRWHEALSKLHEPVSFRIKFPWYMTNEWYRIFTGRLKWTVPMLRKGRKGHRKFR